MKTLLTLFVLLFSSSVVAEKFNCRVLYKDFLGEEEGYNVVIDTGEKTKALSIVSLNSKKMTLDEILITPINSVGMIYTEEYKYNDFYVTTSPPYLNQIRGFFIHLKDPITVIIDISKAFENHTTLTISDPDKFYLSKGLHLGACEDMD